MNTFKGSVRKKDGSKVIYDVGNVETFEDARQAMLDQPDIQCAIVVVPKPVPEYIMEPQTA